MTRDGAVEAVGGACERMAREAQPGGRGLFWSPGWEVSIWGRGAGAGLVVREGGGLRKPKQWAPMIRSQMVLRRRVTNG